MLIYLYAELVEMWCVCLKYLEMPLASMTKEEWLVISAQPFDSQFIPAGHAMGHPVCCLAWNKYGPK